MILTEAQRTTIMNALYVAAAQYKKDSARVMDGEFHPVSPRIRRQFESQAAEAVKLAEVLEEAAEIEVNL